MLEVQATWKLLGLWMRQACSSAMTLQWLSPQQLLRPLCFLSQVAQVETSLEQEAAQPEAAQTRLSQLALVEPAGSVVVEAVEALPSILMLLG
jgi:hypothetical protein